jgi:hypothetical protein
MKMFMKAVWAIASAGGLAVAVVAAEQDKEVVTVKGEVLDMACYLDSGKSGPKHAECARTCIESGTPVGLKAEDGKVYLVIGEHKPANKDLAPYAGKTVTLRGKVVTRDGVSLLENAEIIK